jgi:hypothetical protein
MPKIEWSMGEGQHLLFETTRPLTQDEWAMLMKILELGHDTFVAKPALDAARTPGEEGRGDG